MRRVTLPNSPTEQDEGLGELYSHTKIKQTNNADRGRNIGGNNAPSWAFISSSNRVAGLQGAGFVCQKKEKKTNKQESSEKPLPDAKAEKGESKSQSSSTSFYLLIKGWPDYFTGTQLSA